MGALGGPLGTSWALLGRSWALGGLLEQSLRAFGAILEAIRAILEASWMVLKPSWKRFGSSWGPNQSPKVTQRGPKRSQIDLLRRLELKMAKPQNLSTVRRISMIFDVLRALLGTTIVTKSGLGPLESRFEPSWGSWRLSEGSWRQVGESSGRIRQRPGEG